MIGQSAEREGRTPNSEYTRRPVLHCRSPIMFGRALQSHVGFSGCVAFGDFSAEPPLTCAACARCRQLLARPSMLRAPTLPLKRRRPGNQALAGSLPRAESAPLLRAHPGLPRSTRARPERAAIFLLIYARTPRFSCPMPCPGSDSGSLGGDGVSASCFPPGSQLRVSGSPSPLGGTRAESMTGIPARHTRSSYRSTRLCLPDRQRSFRLYAGCCSTHSGRHYRQTGAPAEGVRSTWWPRAKRGHQVDPGPRTQCVFDHASHCRIARAGRRWD